MCLNILTLGPPPLDESKWSSNMKDFLRICLVKDPVLRPASDELMSHPWITTNNGEAEQQAARDAFLKLLLDYRSKKQVEPETILLRAGTM